MHEPVLLGETVTLLNLSAARRAVDATLGGGGHAEAILRALPPDGQLLGLDADPEAVARARERLAAYGDRFQARHARFSRLAEALAAAGWDAVDAVLFDLGVSSFQLEDPRRGFSFQEDGPLDMRMNPDEPLTAAELVNRLSERELESLLRAYGEEPRARRIARAIVERRASAPFTRTLELAACVEAAVGGRRGARLHPATRTFQALRMAVNREPEELAAGLEAGLAALRRGGRMAVISFHSLEDRAVKQFARAHEGRWESLPEGGARWRGATPAVRAVTRRAVRPTEDECRRNPRARSARLRVVERVE